jgi:hypothetical protein
MKQPQRLRRELSPVSAARASVGAAVVLKGLTAKVPRVELAVAAELAAGTPFAVVLAEEKRGAETPFAVARTEVE